MDEGKAHSREVRRDAAVQGREDKGLQMRRKDRASGICRRQGSPSDRLASLPPAVGD